jgi:hypothetical protein
MEIAHCKEDQRMARKRFKLKAAVANLLAGIVWNAAAMAVIEIQRPVDGKGLG